MSDWNMLIWLTQLGLSVVLPLAGMTGLAIWLCSQYQLGRWVILLGILLGFILAVCSFKNTLKEMEYMEKRRRESHSQKDKKIVLRETGIIAIGECVGVAVMIIIFALLGQFDRSVVLGGLIGGILSILNFFLMAVNANDAADKAINQDVKSGKAMLQFSYAARLAMIFVILFACVKSSLCNAFAIVIPLLFVRPTITIAEFFRKSGD